MARFPHISAFPYELTAAADITVGSLDGEQGGTSVCITPVVQITSVEPVFYASNATLDGELQYTWTAPTDAQVVVEVAGPDGNYSLNKRSFPSPARFAQKNTRNAAVFVYDESYHDRRH